MQILALNSLHLPVMERISTRSSYLARDETLPYYMHSYYIETYSKYQMCRCAEVLLFLRGIDSIISLGLGRNH